MGDFLTSILRTVVPLVVGFVVTQLARLGIEMDTALVASFVTAVISGVYYAVARWLEQKASKWGWLLGKAKAPTYK